jgi:hypothetical protein
MAAFDAQRVPVPDDARAAVADLVDRYRRNQSHYHSPSYNEAQARVDFIDPLFEALGWDIANRAGYAEPYRDVIHEDSIRVSGAVKAPDYCFRIGGQRRFFLEAKKPSVSVKDEQGPAYQLRRYGWSAHLPLSILTDFEEFAVYDCRRRPKPADGASVARIDFLTCDQYLDRLDDLYSVFSKEAVLRGSFDRYAQDTARKRGTTEVDDEFLKEIEAWRDLLARDIALHNPGLSVPDLNFAVQATIDRILFLRIAEDRGVEPYGRLRDLAAGPDLYPRLCALFLEADAKYNAGLFDFSKTGDALSMGLSLADKPLKSIFSGLYYPQSPYEFSVIGADILGAVYEQFLGKVIRLTPGHHAKVEEKPEVRKAGGVYYTPRYIVDYIVEHTVGEAVREAASPDAVAKLRLLDPACGSGSFLLGAYQYLLDWHLRWYVEHNPKKHARGPAPVLVEVGAGDWRLTSHERKRILQSGIFGVDLDPQAVEVTKLNLLLKGMEGETAQSADQSMKLFHERLLPNLDRNIKCGNSLIGPDYFEGRSMALVDEEELRRVRPFDWRAEFPEIMEAGGFDCVIGNPPYARVQVLQEWHAEQVPYLKSHYAAAAGSFDIYAVFVERGYSLLSPAGRMGYIVPHKFFPSQFGEALREFISERRALSEVVHFGHHRVFSDADTYTCLLFLGARPGDQFRMVEILDPDSVEAELARVKDVLASQTGSSRVGSLPQPPPGRSKWAFKVGATGGILDTLKRAPHTLRDVTDRIFVGLQTSADSVYVLGLSEAGAAGRTGTTVVRSEWLQEDVEVEQAMLKPFLLGRDLCRYQQPTVTRAVLFPYVVSDGGAVLLPEADLRRNFPGAYEYLRRCRPALEQRDRGQTRAAAWYAFGRTNNLGSFEQPKALMRELGARANLLPDPDGAYYHTAKIYSVIPRPGGPSLDCIVALLNSAVSTYFVSQTSEIWGTSFKFKTQFLAPLPVPAGALQAAFDGAAAQLCRVMLDLHKRLAEAKNPSDRDLLQRQIDSTDRQIDQLVYELYGLTDDEIAIVEAATERWPRPRPPPPQALAAPSATPPPGTAGPSSAP